MTSVRLAPTLLRQTQTVRSISRPAVNQIRFVSMTGSDNLISNTIKKDHRDLEESRDRILSASDADTKQRWANQFTWQLARHSIAEELVIYPAMEKSLPDGEVMADKDRDEHHIVKEKLNKFQNLKSTDPDFEPTLKSIWDDLGAHIKEEEDHDLPSLEKAIDRDYSETLSSEFRLTQKFVPTRSHPAAGENPIFESVAGLLVAPVDHLRDLFRKFPREAKSEMPP